MTCFYTSHIIFDNQIFNFYCCNYSLIHASYGDMPAHNLLWRECEKSSDDVVTRLAVIPLVQVMFNN